MNKEKEESLKEFKRIHQALQNIYIADKECHDRWCATAHQIQQELKSIFGDRVNILCPIRVKDNQFGNPQNLQAIHCFQLIKSLTTEERKRPIIILWRSNEAYQTLSDMRTGPHWQSYVIIPDNYTTCLGIKKQNQHPILYFKDTLNKPSQPCWLLTQLLQATESDSQIAGCFPQLKVVNCNNFYCAQQRENDSGFWFLYFSIMLTLQASHDFWFLKSTSQPFGRKLRAFFNKIGKKKQEQKEIGKKHSETTIRKARIIQKIIQQKLTENIQSKDSKLVQQFIQLNDNLNLEQLISLVSSKKFQGEQSLKVKIDKIKEIKQEKMCFMGGSISSIIEDFAQNESLQIKDIVKQNQHNDSFTDMLRSDFYVDKSLFLETVLNKRSVYISRPKGWGKTLFFQMATQFFRSDLPKLGKKQKQSINLFKGGVYCGHEYKKLKIADNEEMMKQFGAWPVISISFLIDYNFQIFHNLFLIQIKREYQRYSQQLIPFLRKNNKIYELDLYQRIISNKHVNQIEAFQSLCFLAQLLHGCWKKKVIILIDNADIFINKIQQDRQRHKKRKGFQQGWLSICLRLTQIIETALLFGNQKINQMEMYQHMKYSGIENVIRVNQLKHFADVFGFTEDQMDQLCQRVVANKNWIAQKKLLQEWYNRLKISGITLYNPQQITNCLIECKKNGSVNYENIYPAQNNLEFISNLLEKNLTEWIENIRLLLIQGNIAFFKKSVKDQYQITNFDDFCSLLVKEGYLVRLQKSYTYKMSNNHAKLKFWTIVCQRLLHFKEGQFQIASILDNMAASLDDSKRFQNEVNSMFGRIPIDQDINEYYFNSIFGSMAQLSSIISTKSMAHRTVFQKYTEHQTRIDNIFIPILGKSATIVIHQYKVHRKNQGLDEVLESAIWQILLKGYLSVTVKKKKAGWNEVISRAVVFYIANNRWQVAVKQFIHTFEQAKNLVQKFNILKQTKQTKEKSTQKIENELKATFLRQQGFQNIQDFLRSNYSVSQKQPFTKIQLVQKSRKDSKKKQSSKQQSLQQRLLTYHKQFRNNYLTGFFKKKRQILLSDQSNDNRKFCNREGPQHNK